MSMVLGLAGGIIGAIGQISSANAQSQADTYNANLAARNAQISGQDAARSASDKRRETQQRLGMVVAATGANGFTMSGSPLDVLEQTASNGELDAMTIQYMGKNTSDAYRSEAGLYRSSAANALTTGYFNAAGTLLSAGARAFSSPGGTGNSLKVS